MSKKFRMRAIQIFHPMVDSHIATMVRVKPGLRAGPRSFFHIPHNETGAEVQTLTQSWPILGCCRHHGNKTVHELFLAGCVCVSNKKKIDKYKLMSINENSRVLPYKYRIFFANILLGKLENKNSN